MVSERSLNANRENARASTGPRTSKGKSRASQNARKHGLAAGSPYGDADGQSELLIDSLSAEVEARPESNEVILAVAESDHHLKRVRLVKFAILCECEAALAERGEGADRNALTVCDQLQQLDRLERYERRALSRRKAAIRRLMLLRHSAAEGQLMDGEE